MANIPIQFYSGTNSATGIWTYNAFAGSLATTTGQISADLLDDTNTSTGYTLDIITAFTGASGSSGNATSGTGNFPESSLDDYWYFNTSPTLRIGGLTNGDSYTIECIGHIGNQATRDTDFTIGGTTERYDASGTSTPNAAVSISGTVSGTTLDIDVALVSTFGYVNGLYVTITAGGPTIDTEPAETRATEQGSFVISGPATAPTTGNTTIKLVDGSGPSATIDSVTGSDPYTINYTFPKTTNKQFNSTGYVHYITIDAESVSSSTIPYLPETNWDFVDVGTPDTGTEIYTQYGGSTFVTGDQCVWDTVSDPDGSTVTIDDTLNWDINPSPTSAQTVGLYRIAANDTKDSDDTLSFQAAGETSAVVDSVVKPVLTSLLKDII